MLTLHDVKIDLESLGKRMLLVDVVPAYAYKDNQRTDTVAGYKYVVCLVDHNLKKLAVKIDGQPLMEKPVKGYVEVEFDGLEVRAYEVPAGAKFTAKAKGIRAVNAKHPQ